MIVREDTPPRGVPAQTFAQSERSWLVPTVLIVVVAVTLGIVGWIFARSDTGPAAAGHDPRPTAGAAAGAARARSRSPR